MWRFPCCVWAILALAGILWLFTLGVVIQNYRSYGGQSKIQTGEGLPITLWIDTHVEDWGVPVLLLYVTDRTPYSIEMSVFDRGPTTARKLLLEGVSIVYPDGAIVQVVSPQDNWGQEFREGSPRGVIDTSVGSVQHCFGGVIGRPSDVRLRIKGWYLLEDGSKVSLQVDEEYRLRREWRITSGWARLANM